MLKLRVQLWFNNYYEMFDDQNKACNICFLEEGEEKEWRELDPALCYKRKNNLPTLNFLPNSCSEFITKRPKGMLT